MSVSQDRVRAEWRFVVRKNTLAAKQGNFRPWSAITQDGFPSLLDRALGVAALSLFQYQMGSNKRR